MQADSRSDQEPENIDVDKVVRDINASVADVLTRSLAPYIQMASESTAQCSAVSQVLKNLPEFQTLLEEKLQLAAEVAELRARLATAENSGIKLRVSELASSEYLVPRDVEIANLAKRLYPANAISRALSPYHDSLSEDESDEGSSGSEPLGASDTLMGMGMEGLLAAATGPPEYKDKEVNESEEDEAESGEDSVTGDEEEITPSFPTHPLAAHVEVAMEEEDEELYEIELMLPGDTDPTAFYTPDVDNGTIYEIDDNEEPGEEVGRLENGIPNWAIE